MRLAVPDFGLGLLVFLESGFHHMANRIAFPVGWLHEIEFHLFMKVCDGHLVHSPSTKHLENGESNGSPLQ